MSRLRNHWRGILRVYFPRWKAGQNWRCTSSITTTAHGECDCKRKLVRVGVISGDDNELDLLLIHEVAHAVAPPGHGPKWLRRVEQAAKAAQKVGRVRLAQLLCAEVAAYRDQGITVESIYVSVADAVQENPTLTFDQIRRFVAAESGLRRSEVEKVFSRLNRVYEAARGDIEQMTT